MSEARMGVENEIAVHHVRRGLGSLQKGLLASLALNALGLLILQGNHGMSDSSEHCEQVKFEGDLQT